jgi:hypothetical protein
MLYFLPPLLKKDIQKEYFLRLCVLGLVLSLLLVVFSFVLLLPSYFLSDAKEHFTVGRAEIIQNNERESDIQSAALEFDTFKQNLKAMKPEQVSVLPSEILDTIFKNQKKGISIRQVLYVKAVGAGLGSVELVGTALSRDVLVGYAKILRGEKIFTTVDFPISNLAGEKNIDFTIKTTGKF